MTRFPKAFLRCAAGQTLQPEYTAIFTPEEPVVIDGVSIKIDRDCAVSDLAEFLDINPRDERDEETQNRGWRVSVTAMDKIWFEAPIAYVLPWIFKPSPVQKARNLTKYFPAGQQITVRLSGGPVFAPHSEFLIEYGLSVYVEKETYA